jgi:hypothetical protein
LDFDEKWGKNIGLLVKIGRLYYNKKYILDDVERSLTAK